VDRFLKGFLALADQFKVSLAGGDTAESPAGILADIIVLGSVPKGKAILRSGAKPGDRIYVTGELGGASAALQYLFAGKQLRPQDFPSHFHPLPRIRAGQFLRQRKLASAMIDLSDGLSTDLGHICEESGVGAEILASALPSARVAKGKARIDFQHALHGGDDYELLFTAPPSKRVPDRIAGVNVRLIGEVRRGKKMFLIKENGSCEELKPKGWEHFR
jgi:thiamine-monophosphate kinase